MEEVFKKLIRGEIKIRKSLHSHLQGERRSLFKGSGLEFDDVRPYQYGDDVRSIHWSVSSKGQGVYVKTFKEEKEQTVFFLVDVSASQHIGQNNKQKINLAREVCGTLLLSAIHDSSQVGMLLFSNEVERLIKPKKGIQHAHKLIRELYRDSVKSPRTHIAVALQQVLQLFKRSIVLIVLSDFIDQAYEKPLKGVAHRHDLILLHLQSPQEQHFPSLGLLPFQEPETRQTRWFNTQSKHFRQQIESTHKQRRQMLEALSMKYGTDYVNLSTEEDYLVKLVDLFRRRNRRRHGG